MATPRHQLAAAPFRFVQIFSGAQEFPNDSHSSGNCDAQTCKLKTPSGEVAALRRGRACWRPDRCCAAARLSSLTMWLPGKRPCLYHAQPWSRTRVFESADSHLTCCGRKPSGTWRNEQSRCFAFARRKKVEFFQVPQAEQALKLHCDMWRLFHPNGFVSTLGVYFCSLGHLAQFPGCRPAAFVPRLAILRLLER